MIERKDADVTIAGKTAQRLIKNNLEGLPDVVVISFFRLFLRLSAESSIHPDKTLIDSSLSLICLTSSAPPDTVLREDANSTTYFINMSFIIIIDVSDVNDDSL